MSGAKAKGVMLADMGGAQPTDARRIGSGGSRAQAPWGVVAAMDIEADRLKEHLRHTRVTSAAGMEFFTGELEGQSVVVVRCGVGKVNAAVCAQALIDRFAPCAIVNTGVAGALDARLGVGDIVVSVDAVHHDMDVTNLGYAKGQVPQMDVLAFPADASLRAAALAAARTAAPDVQTLEGRVLSGYRFVCTLAVKERIHREFGGMCCEMEGAALAQACWLNHVPFVIVRVVSDKADGSDAVEYPVFEARAANRSAAIVERLVAKCAMLS